MAESPGVFVTGAGRGIGRAIANRFARDGARLAVNDYYRFRAGDTEAWLTGMNKLQRRLEPLPPA